MEDISIETRKAYAEILEVLKNLPIQYKNEIPSQILEIFEKEKMYGYAILVDKNNLINKQTLRKETLEILAMLNYQYWCKNEDLKNKLYEIYNSNENISQNILDIEEIVSKSREQNVSLAIRKENIFTRIINKIKSFVQSLKKTETFNIDNIEEDV